MEIVNMKNSRVFSCPMKFFLKEWMIEIKGLVKSSVDVLLESTNLFINKMGFS